jgi:small subunit ribosomal protein S1
VTPGQTLKVRVTRIDNPESGKERIALAAADLGPDPWETARETLAEGAIVKGRVVRLAEFGAFVNLLPGIDGLVHVSELPPKPAEAPGPFAVAPGDEIEVRVVRLDLDKKRVSLSTRLQPPAPRPAREARDPREAREPRDGREGRRPRREPRDRDRDRDRDRETAPFATGGSLTHNMAEQLGALRRKLQVRP